MFAAFHSILWAVLTAALPHFSIHNLLSIQLLFRDKRNLLIPNDIGYDHRIFYLYGISDFALVLLYTHTIHPFRSLPGLFLPKGLCEIHHDEVILFSYLWHFGLFG